MSPENTNNNLSINNNQFGVNNGRRTPQTNFKTTKSSKFIHCCLFCCSGITIIFGIILIVIGGLCWSNSVYDFLMEDRLNMRPGLPSYEFWSDPKPVVLLRLRVFNVTNADEFLSGADAKLKFNEVGPVVYREILRHSDMVFNENSTLSYTTSKEIIYLEDQNIPGILNQTVVVPNLVTLGIASHLDDSAFFVNMGVKIMMDQSDEGPFKTMTIYDLLWNYKSDVLAWSKSLGGSVLVPTENMGLIYNIYNSYSDRLNVQIGAQNGPNDFFAINWFNYRTTVPGFKLERGDCNASIVGATEGAIYRQKLQKNDSILYWRKSLCRPVTLFYEKDHKKGPLFTYKFSLPTSSFNRSLNGEEDCYEGRQNLPDGLSDLSKCFHKFTFAASNPHFYGTNGTWMDKIEGLHGEKSLHENYLYVEPIMGVPAESMARTQVNLVVTDKMSSVFSSDMKKFQGMVLPIVWLEYEQPDLTPTIVALTSFMVNTLPEIENYIGPVFVASGTLLILIVVVTSLCRGRKNEKDIFVVNGKP